MLTGAGQALDHVLGGAVLQSVCLEVNKLEQLFVVRYVCGTLAVLLPFKHCVGIKFELKCRGDEGGRWRIVHCLQSAKVLLSGWSDSHSVTSNT